MLLKLMFKVNWNTWNPLNWNDHADLCYTTIVCLLKIDYRVNTPLLQPNTFNIHTSIYKCPIFIKPVVQYSLS